MMPKWETFSYTNNEIPLKSDDAEEGESWRDKSPLINLPFFHFYFVIRVQIAESARVTRVDQSGSVNARVVFRRLSD